MHEQGLLFRVGASLFFFLKFRRAHCGEVKFISLYSLCGSTSLTLVKQACLVFATHPRLAHRRKPPPFSRSSEPLAPPLRGAIANDFVGHRRIVQVRVPSVCS